MLENISVVSPGSGVAIPNSGIPVSVPNDVYGTPVNSATIQTASPNTGIISNFAIASSSDIPATDVLNNMPGGLPVISTPDGASGYSGNSESGNSTVRGNDGNT